MGVALHVPKWRLLLALLVVCAMSVFGVMKGIVVPADAFALVGLLDLSDAATGVVLWAGFGVAVRAAGLAWLLEATMHNHLQTPERHSTHFPGWYVA